MEKHTAIIILNYNCREDTIACIKSVETYNSASIKYIVVENGSTRRDEVCLLDESLKEAFGDRYACRHYRDERCSSLPYVTLLVDGENSGYAKGNNKGLEWAASDASIDRVLILNSDILFVEDIIPELAKLQDEWSECAVISPVLYKANMLDLDFTCARRSVREWELIIETFCLSFNYFGFSKKIRARNWLLKNDMSLLERERIEVELPSGSCMLIRKTLFEDIGMFDPGTFLYYEEDILYRKLTKLGLVNYVIPRLKCIHLGATSTSRVPSFFIQKVGADSRGYFLRNYCELSVVQKLLSGLALFLYRRKIQLVKLLKRK